ncbi:HAD family hydrolase [Acinetobacter sp. G11]|uniref:HAD family hydrolase n=1 Tax=Acinetobacter sp. G11 TaxID=3415989 RepID=UPI003C7C5ECB
MLKLVIFDLDRTLLDWDRTQRFARQQLNEKIVQHVSVDAFWQAYEVLRDTLWDAYMQQDLMVSEYRLYRYLKPLQQCGIDDVELAKALNQSFMQHALQHHHFCEGAEEALNLCQALGLQMAVLTNGPAQGQLQKIRHLHLERWCTHYFISDEQGVAKPHPQAFLNVCQAFRLHPQQCLMVGDDNEVDIQAAQQLGLHTYWISPAQQQDTEIQPHTWTKFLSDLKQMFSPCET